MFEHEDLDEVFSLLARIGQAVVATVGSNCEVVIHDLRKPEYSVVAISGNLTQRYVGSPVPDPELLPENVDRFVSDSLLYRTQTPFGRSLLSSTVWVRDKSCHIVGALCINMDFGDIRAARDLLERVLAAEPAKNGKVIPTFATSPEDFVSMSINGVLTEIGKEKHQLDKDDKLVAIERLRDAGVFSLRRASDLVAAELGVSRATVYAYLKDIRESKAEDEEEKAV